MNAFLAWLSPLSKRITLQPKQPAPPEPLRPQGRPMTGFLSTLSPEQRKAAMEYCGADTQG
jgi:hypothetical protein